MGDATVEAVRVFSVAQAVDEGSQLTHVVHFSSHHHLFMDDVGLRQVGSLLRETEQQHKQAGWGISVYNNPRSHAGHPHDKVTSLAAEKRESHPSL